MTRLRTLIALLVAVLATTGLSGCSTASKPSASGSAARPLVVGLTYQPDIQFSLFYAALEQGWFTQAGLNVQLRHHGASETLFGAMQAGQEDIVFAGGDEMMQARSQDVDVINFATIYRTHPVVLIVPEDSPIHSAADLRGHSVGVPGPYGENWFGLLAMLQSNGLTQNDVSVQNIGYTQQAALSGRRVDAVVGFANNDVVRFQQTGFPVRTIPVVTGTATTPLVGAGLGASASTIDSRQAELSTLMTVLRRAAQLSLDDPARVVELSRSQIPTLGDADQRTLAQAVLVATTKLYGPPEALGAQSGSEWSAMSTFMWDQQLLLTPVLAQQAYTATISGQRA